MVQERRKLGSAESRRLRRGGLVPGVLYGRGEPTPICVGERDLRTALTGEGGLHAILDVVVEGSSSAHPSVLKEYQQDVVRGGITHVDLYEVRLDRPIQATVTVTLVGDSAGVKEGGVLSQVTRELTVEALPMEIPEHLDFDVSELGVGDTARLADLQPPEGVSLLDDPDTVLATVTLPTRVEEPEVEVEEVEAEEAEAAEGEAPEGGAEERAEPEAGAGEQQPTEG